MRRIRIVVVVAAMLLALAGSLSRPAWAAPMHGEGSPAPSSAIDAATLQERYGVRIDKVAVTGGGGLVDVRFTVLDPGKARPILQDPASRPKLVVEDGGLVLDGPVHGLMRNVRLQKDAACFLLYPNARGAVKSGTRVAVAFGNVKVASVVAQ